MHPNTIKLRAIMAEAKLTAKDVAAIVNREPMTVFIWRGKSDARVIPSELLRLLELSTAKAAA